MNAFLSQVKFQNSKSQEKCHKSWLDLPNGVAYIHFMQNGNKLNRYSYTGKPSKYIDSDAKYFPINRLDTIAKNTSINLMHALQQPRKALLEQLGRILPSDCVTLPVNLNQHLR